MSEPVIPEAVDAARGAYVKALNALEEHFLDAVWKHYQKNNLIAEWTRQLEIHRHRIDLARAKYDELRDRLREITTAQQRATDESIAKSNNALVEKQAQIAEKQLDLGNRQIAVGKSSARAAWFAGVAALAAVLVPIVQSCCAHH